MRDHRGGRHCRSTCSAVGSISPIVGERKRVREPTCTRDGCLTKSMGANSAARDEQRSSVDASALAKNCMLTSHSLFARLDAEDMRRSTGAHGETRPRRTPWPRRAHWALRVASHTWKAHAYTRDEAAIWPDHPNRPNPTTDESTRS